MNTISIRFDVGATLYRFVRQLIFWLFRLWHFWLDSKFSAIIKTYLMREFPKYNISVRNWLDLIVCQLFLITHIIDLVKIDWYFCILLERDISITRIHCYNMFIYE